MKAVKRDGNIRFDISEAMLLKIQVLCGVSLFRSIRLLGTFSILQY
jgi:hypothetical protein